MSKILVSILLIFSVFADDDIIGRVVNATGTVTRVNQSHSEKIKSGSSIHKNDELRTSKNSFVKILMKDDTVFQLGANSKFKFEKFEFDGKNKEKRKASYNLLYGKMRGLFIKPAPKEITLHTPSVSLGVRGTELLTDVYWDPKDTKAKLPKTDVALLSGKLQIDLSRLNLPHIKQLELTPGNVFDSSRALKSKNIKYRFTSPIPAKVFNNLKSGKETFLFDASQAKSNFPQTPPTLQQKKITAPSKQQNADSKAVIDEAKKKELKKKLQEKKLEKKPLPELNEDVTLPDNVDSTGTTPNH